MSLIRALVDRLRDDSTCILRPPVPWTEPAIRDLPGDLRQFYEYCDGLILFLDSSFAWEIVGSKGMIPTNLEIIGEQVENDITSSWVVIARQRDDSSALISIDLNVNRLGWCYDSDVEVHGLVGDCPILAFSFTELLQQLVDAHGNFIFWEEESFVYKGDAYDAIDNSSRGAGGGKPF